MHLHTRFHTGETPYKFQTCAQVFTSSVKPKNHMCVNHGKMPVEVSTDLVENSLVEKELSRVRKREYEKPYGCNTCELAFWHEENLKLHAETCQRKTPYKCETCEESFTVKGHHTSHQTNCIALKPYRCQYCSKVFALDAGLINHMDNIHRKMSIEQHMLASRVITEVPHNRKLDNYSSLIEWERSDLEGDDKSVSGNSKSTYCNVWNESGTENSDSIQSDDDTFRRESVNANEIRNQEDIVVRKKSDSSDENLYDESLIDKKEMENDLYDNCESCHEGYRTSGDSRAHMKTHSSEKSYECPVCDKKFKCNFLRSHLRLHVSNVPPYICPICQLKYIRYNALVNHLIEHSTRCFKCRKYFVFKSHLQRHVQNFHLKKLVILQKETCYFYQSSSEFNDHNYAAPATTECEKVFAHFDHEDTDMDGCESVSERSTLSVATRDEKEMRLLLSPSVKSDAKEMRTFPLFMKSNEKEIRLVPFSVKIENSDSNQSVEVFVCENDSMKHSDDIEEKRNRSDRDKLSFWTSVGKNVQSTESISKSGFQSLQNITNGRPFRTLRSLQHRIELQHRNDRDLFYGEDKHYVCSICLRSFKTKQATVKHFKTHS